MLLMCVSILSWSSNQQPRFLTLLAAVTTGMLSPTCKESIFIYIVNANLMKLLQVSLDALIAMYYNCTVKTCYTEIGKQSLVLFSCTYWPGKELLFTQGVI